MNKDMEERKEKNRNATTPHETAAEDMSDAPGHTVGHVNFPALNECLCPE